MLDLVVAGFRNSAAGGGEGWMQMAIWMIGEEVVTLVLWGGGVVLRVVEKWVVEEWVVEERVVEKRVIKNILREKRVAEKRVIEKRVVDNRVIEKRVISLML